MAIPFDFKNTYDEKEYQQVKTKYMSDTKEKKTRTPKNAEAITKGALALPLKDRVQLRDDLQMSIVEEVETLQEAAKQAAAIANQKS